MAAPEGRSRSSIMPSQPLRPQFREPLTCGKQGLVALREAEADHAMIGAVLIERRQRNRCDTDFADQTLGESTCRLVADSIVTRQLKIAARAGEHRQRCR